MTRRDFWIIPAAIALWAMPAVWAAIITICYFGGVWIYLFMRERTKC